MQFFLGDDVAQVELPGAGQGGEARLQLQSGQTISAAVVLVAVGRRGNVDGLNLQAAGVGVNPQGNIEVNESFQTSVPHIYAVGDVVGWPASASTSMEQARVAAAHAFESVADGHARAYPVAIYTIPEMAMVGLSEEACAQQGMAHAVGRADFENNPYAQITGDTSGLLKLVFEPANQRLLGVQLMCAGAADLIHLGAFVLATGGTLDAFIHSVYNYPTLSEAYKAAAFDGLDRLRRKAEAGLGD
jgi:NAD(P) transhydrogenase